VLLCRLFSVDAEVEADLYVSYTFKLSPLSSSSTQLGVCLRFDRPDSELWLVGEESCDYSSLCGSDLTCLRFAQQQTVGIWTTRYVSDYYHQLQ